MGHGRQHEDGVKEGNRAGEERRVQDREREDIYTSSCTSLAFRSVSCCQPEPNSPEPTSDKLTLEFLRLSGSKFR